MEELLTHLKKALIIAKKKTPNNQPLIRKIQMAIIDVNVEITHPLKNEKILL